MTNDLKLLVEWSSPWREFWASIRPALAKSATPLAGEARTDFFPYQGILLSWAIEVTLLVAVIVLPEKLAGLRPYQPPPMPKYDVIYFSGDELPQTEDQGGAKAGKSGLAGGHEAHHHTQTIRVSRGEALRQIIADAPHLNLPQSNSAVANLLAFKPIPGPAPAEGLTSSARAPQLADPAIAPAPEVEREKMRAGLTMSAPIVPPAPNGPQRDLTPVPIPGSQALAVIPPPVSAPAQLTNLHSQLTLPPPSVIAPPPQQITRDIASHGPGFGAGELQKQIVPPPVQLASTASDTRTFGGLGNAKIVPPPVQVNGAVAGRSNSVGLGAPSVVPPPVQIGGGSLHQAPKVGLGGGSGVVPPPPTVTANAGSGLGHGTRGGGLGGPFDAGSAAAPPSNTGGNIAGNGIVVSNQPGSNVGVPGSGGAGSLAMSPLGGDKPGSGEGQGGSGIARGEGPGSGFSGADSGSASSGNGPGADMAANSGISPFPGGGGAGTGTVGHPPIPGVSVHGGNNIITLPSFGADGKAPSLRGRSIAMNRGGPDITVVGSSRSGGALNLYGALKGDKVYTIYIDTALGTAIMEYADPTSATHPYADDLTAPEPVRANLPANLKPSRLVISCVLDRSGLVRNAKVLEAGGSEMTSKVLAALSSWKFRPVFHGDQPVEVTAILGFAIDTR